MNPLTQSKNATILPVLIALTLACFGLSPAARAVDPPPDGGYPNQNTAEGEDALLSLTTGGNNTAIGFNTLFNNTTGNFNTANGSFALGSNIVGDGNTANGYGALFTNTHGNFNTATGAQALFRNTRGFANTATGYRALFSNKTGDDNTANGYQALENNTTGDENTATGFQALLSNTTGFLNTANGYQALEDNTTGGNNTATGVRALENNTTGIENTAIGSFALFNNNGNDNTAIGHLAMEFHLTGDNNTAIGQEALRAYDGNDNTAIGQNAIWSIGTGNNNIALGSSAGKRLTAGDNNIFIGNVGPARESNTIRIGTPGTQTATHVAGISGATVPDGVAVIVGADGHLGTIISSARYKEAIKPMDKASEAIFSLQPVRFHYKKQLDPAGIPQFGLVAGEVAKVNPDLVARDSEGKPYTVRYEAVNAMLLNEFLKEHRKVETLEASLAQVEKDSRARAAKQQCEIDSLTATLKAQATQIQKVSDQIKTQAPAPRVVAND